MPRPLRPAGALALFWDIQNYTSLPRLFISPRCSISSSPRSSSVTPQLPRKCIAHTLLRPVLLCGIADLPFRPRRSSPHPSNAYQLAEVPETYTSPSLSYLNICESILAVNNSAPCAIFTLDNSSHARIRRLGSVVAPRYCPDIYTFQSLLVVALSLSSPRCSALHYLCAPSHRGLEGPPGSRLDETVQRGQSSPNSPASAQHSLARSCLHSPGACSISAHPLDQGRTRARMLYLAGLHGKRALSLRSKLRGPFSLMFAGLLGQISPKACLPRAFDTIMIDFNINNKMLSCSNDQLYL